jgi:hypothetical protein
MYKKYICSVRDDNYGAGSLMILYPNDIKMIREVNGVKKVHLVQNDAVVEIYDVIEITSSVPFETTYVFN